MNSCICIHCISLEGCAGLPNGAIRLVSLGLPRCKDYCPMNLLVCVTFAFT